MSKKTKIASFMALSIAMFMSMLDSTIINIALPDITTFFHANLSDTSWISSIYVIGLAVFMIPASKFADQFGRKKVMIIGIVLFGGCSAMCGLSHSLMFLILMRLFQGIGAAMITPIVMPMGIEIFGKEKLQPVSAAIGAVTALAAAAGPPLGGLLIKYVSWQAIFFVNVPFSIICLLLTITTISESHDDTASKSIDWIGMVLLTASLSLLTFALLKGNDYGWTSAITISMFIGSAVSLTLFIITELKVKAPLMELQLFREPTFTSSSFVNMISGFGCICPFLIFSYFLQNLLGYDALKAAFIIMWVALTVIISMPLGTLISSKLDARPINMLGNLLMGISVIAMSRMKVTTSVTIMSIEMIVFGIGMGFASQTILTAVKHLPKEKSGVGSGIFNAMRQVGICLGIAVLVSALDSNVSIAKDMIQNNAIASVKNSSIVSSVKSVMVKDINESFTDSKSDNGTSDTQKSLQDKLKTDVTNSLSSTNNIPKPQNNETLGKLYEGANTLSDGAVQASDGQKTLNNGIDSLNSGLITLYSGSHSLTSAANTLDYGISKTLTGSQKLSSGFQKLNSFNNGLATLSKGTLTLSSGLNQLFAQFSSTSNGNITLKDKISTLNDGAKQVSSGASSLKNGAEQVSDGTAALKAQFSSGSHSNPTLRDQIAALNSGAQSYVHTSSAIMKALRGNSSVYSSIKTSLLAALSTSTKDTTSISNLTTSLVLVTATNDATQLTTTIGLLNIEGIVVNQTYITEQQTNYDNGGTSLTSGTSALKSQTKAGTNGAVTLYNQISALNNGAQLVTSGAQSLANGASQVADGTGALDEQMVTDGSGAQTLYDKVSALNSGAAEVASGTSQLVSGTARLGELKNGFDSLISALNQLKSGSSQLMTGSKNLQNGISAAKDGSSQLVNGSVRLVDSSDKIKDGASGIVTGVGKAGQADEIQKVIDSILTNKDDRTAGAFDNTFWLGAIVLCLSSIFGIFTDRKGDPLQMK